jgi:hypothetical protein
VRVPAASPFLARGRAPAACDNGVLAAAPEHRQAHECEGRSTRAANVHVAPWLSERRTPISARCAKTAAAPFGRMLRPSIAGIQESRGACNHGHSHEWRLGRAAAGRAAAMVVASM